MNQFQTVLVGGYRKDEVDERLKELVSQIEELHQEAEAAGEREEQLRSELAEAVRRAEELEQAQKTVMPDGEYDESVSAKEREERLKRELDAALSRLEFLESELEQGSGTRGTQTMPDREGRAKVWQMERRAEEYIRGRRRAAVQALEGARGQVVRYLETLDITRERLADTYSELDALVDQVSSGFMDGAVTEMDCSGFPASWHYPTDAQ